MPDEKDKDIQLNYPDVLGHVTGGQRYNLGVVQVAMALRPRVVRAGRPFEVVLLVQNASDVDVDLTATLHLPDVDAAKKKGRFVTKAQRLVVGLQPAEVGYVVLPLSCLPDTAVGSDYHVGVEVKAAPLVKGNTKPRPVRQPKGGGFFDVAHLAEESRGRLEELKQLAFSAVKHSRLTNSLQAQFSVMSGKLGEVADLKPGWVSLWTLKDQQDDRLLLVKYRTQLTDQVFPKLKRARLFKPLLDAMSTRFEKAGYALRPVEALLIAKLLTLILEYAAPSDINVGAVTAGEFNIVTLLSTERLADERPILLPRWCRSFLRVLAKEPKAAEFPVEAITRLVLPDLLRDAMLHAFRLIEQNTGEDLGTEDEMAEYGENLIAMMEGKTAEKMDFTHAYIPLVLGGLVLFDGVIMPGEKLDQLVQETKMMVEARENEHTEENDLVFRVANRLVDRAIMKYGYREAD